MKDTLEVFGKFINDITRPLVTNVVIFGLTYGFMSDKIDGAAYIGLGGMVLGFWFQKREEARSESK